MLSREGIATARSWSGALWAMELRRPIDLLPDRSAASLAKWLQQHPGVEVIARDRSAIYAEGARSGAPNAVQVADRWHLIKNLADGLEPFLGHHLGDLRAAADRVFAA